jgi:hypothetical protein
MPQISKFYGLIIYMYYFDNIKHHVPHIHVHFQSQSCVLSISTNRILSGSIPIQKRRLVEAWMIIHEKELKENWEKAIKGETISPISPLS